jgi:RNA polymerase-binding transcription factor DksA
MSSEQSTEFEPYKAQLEALKKELSERLSGLSRGAKIALDRSFSEQAVELENRDVAMALDAEAREELVEIEKALQRVASGQYGQCLHCGEDIPGARLAAAPEAAFCIECASRAE